MADFAIAVKQQPNNARFLYLKGETEINLGLYKEAFLTLRATLQLKPRVRRSSPHRARVSQLLLLVETTCSSGCDPYSLLHSTLKP